MSAHGIAQLRGIRCGSGDGIICVEWSERVDLALFMREWPRCGEPRGGCVYMVERAGAPLYVGATNVPLRERFAGHFYGRRLAIGEHVRAACAGECDLTLRWFAAKRVYPTTLEELVIRSEQPALNKYCRGVPGLRRAAA
jgi:hypothetical protein